jgi:hypothetical protein
MGLDMYLTAKRYVSEYQEEDVALSNELKQRFPELREGESIANIDVRVGYWRKANAIHKWFVDHVQDGEDQCRPHYVSKDQLQALRQACLDSIENRSKAVDILPSASGFFFGSTDYDEWYFKDLEYTVKVMDRALELAGTGDWDIEYRSSW